MTQNDMNKILPAAFGIKSNSYTVGLIQQLLLISCPRLVTQSVYDTALSDTAIQYDSKPVIHHLIQH